MDRIRNVRQPLAAVGSRRLRRTRPCHSPWWGSTPITIANAAMAIALPHSSSARACPGLHGPKKPPAEVADHERSVAGHYNGTPPRPNNRPPPNPPSHFDRTKASRKRQRPELFGVPGAEALRCPSSPRSRFHSQPRGDLRRNRRVPGAEALRCPSSPPSRFHSTQTALTPTPITTTVKSPTPAAGSNSPTPHTGRGPAPP